MGWKSLSRSFVKYKSNYGEDHGDFYDDNGKILVFDSSNTYEYDVALSFAGEDREYIEKVADKLDQDGKKSL
jgi:hypothetical protein